MRKKIILEFADHPHVITPWVNLLGEDAKVFTIKENLEATRSALIAYNQSSEVKEITPINILREIFLEDFPKFRLRPLIVVSTAPEFGASLSIAFSSFIVSIIKIDFLCIRSSIRWTKAKSSPREREGEKRQDNYLAPYKFWKSKISNLLGDLIRKILISQSHALVFETYSQKSNFDSNSNFNKNKEGFIFSGRLPHTTFSIEKPIFQDENLSLANLHNSIVIGVLGSINPDRRDYKILEDMVNVATRSKVSLSLVFLGNALHPDALGILERFKSVVAVKVYNEMGFVEESIYFNMIPMLDLLIAPLNRKWGYEEGLGTGAVGDALFLQKPLCLPKFMENSVSLSWVNYFESREDLISLISSVENLKLPPREEKDVKKMKSIIRSKLQL